MRAALDESARERLARVFDEAGKPNMKRLVMVFLLAVGAYATLDAALAQSSCKACADRQKACVKSYGGATCKTDYQMCMKSCRKKKS